MYFSSFCTKNCTVAMYTYMTLLAVSGVFTAVQSKFMVFSSSMDSMPSENHTYGKNMSRKPSACLMPSIFIIRMFNWLFTRAPRLTPNFCEKRERKVYGTGFMTSSHTKNETVKSRCCTKKVFLLCAVWFSIN